MFRHRLASLFNPRSLVLISDIALKSFQNIPKKLESNSTWLRIDEEDESSWDSKISAFERPDLATVCVAHTEIPKVLEALAKNPPRALIVLSGERIEGGLSNLNQVIQAWGQRHQCLIVGPRAFGVQRPVQGLNLSRAKLANPGKVAVISQSQMLLLAVLDWASDINVGLSTAVSLGEVVDVDLPEMIEYFTGDVHTDSIVVYLDKFSSGRELISALRAAASVKPVVILRAGRNDPLLLGHDQVFDAAIRRSGAIRVNYFVELFSALKTMTHKRRPKGGRVVILGNGRAIAQLMWDVMDTSSYDVKLAKIAQSCQEELKNILGKSTLTNNPVIVNKPLEGESLEEALKLLAAEKTIDAILLVLAPDDLTQLDEVINHLADYSIRAKKPIISSLLGETTMKPLRRILDQAGTPAFRTPETAFAGIQALMGYHYNQQLLQQIRIPLLMSKAPDKKSVAALIHQVQKEGRFSLNKEECEQVFHAYHIDNAPEGCEEDMGFTHDDNLPAVAIQIKYDPIFGPWIHFGEGGHKVAISPLDKGLELPPLNAYLASELVKRSRVWQQELSTYVEPHHLEKLQRLLEALADLISDMPEITSLEVNPIFFGYEYLHLKGVEINLAEQSFEAPEKNHYDHMAIYPYPSHLVKHKVFKDGTPWTVRPIRPEDAEAMQAFIRNLSDHSRYMRFISMMAELTPKMLTRYTYVDYHKELALVGTVEVPNPANRGLPQEIIIGLAHYLRNTDGIGAEYALVIADEWQGQGLGRTLMSELLAEAKEQGLEYIEGTVLSNNKPMLGLMTSLGLKNEREPEDPTMRRVWMSFKEE